ncbi:hypothetical protein M422DRAFT_185393 [Sphaerobolus stellatus SS14]|uniref:Calcipressin n=1 Tax=Sphaerobolus stellatus (strain SS14) TaxID=990650 RepID=A0A0C9TP57_SPHS4|nr:hypothetical protein M422DRAFT_185393 [Sphaerobolus stellatus SS14]
MSQSQLSSPPRAGGTNTVILAYVPQSFFHPQVMDIINREFARHGELHSFVPLPSLGRVLIVYYENNSAEDAKQDLDGFQFGTGKDTVTLRVYRAVPTPTSPTEDNYLAPPAVTKNFLISPPGSPPVGWEQIREEPPNATPLADDLIAALSRLQTEQELRGGRGERRTKDGYEVLWHANETAAGVGVYVENCAPNVAVVEEAMDVEDNGEGRWYGSVHDRYGMGLNKGVMMSMPRTTMPPRIR